MLQQHLRSTRAVADPAPLSNLGNHVRSLHAQLPTSQMREGVTASIRSCARTQQSRRSANGSPALYLHPLPPTDVATGQRRTNLREQPRTITFGSTPRPPEVQPVCHRFNAWQHRCTQLRRDRACSADPVHVPAKRNEPHGWIVSCESHGALRIDERRGVARGCTRRKFECCATSSSRALAAATESSHRSPQANARLHASPHAAPPRLQ